MNAGFQTRAICSEGISLYKIIEYTEFGVENIMEVKDFHKHCPKWRPRDGR
jgi:hypothetical protein